MCVVGVEWIWNARLSYVIFMQCDCVLHYLSLINLAILGISFQSFMSIISEHIGHKAKKKKTLSIYPYFVQCFLAPCEFLTKLSKDSSVPGGFWPTRFSLTRWCPTQCNIRDMSLVHSKYLVQLLDLSTLDYHENTLATSFSVNIHIWDIVWPDDVTDLIISLVVQEAIASDSLIPIFRLVPHWRFTCSSSW